jgi:predicted phosphate transport protein (TIGR00153 family)
MKLRLFPRQEDAYFPLFQAAADTSTAAANVLVDLLTDLADPETKAKQLADLEHEGDRITRTILTRLVSTFIARLDRDDIFELAERLDNVTDAIDDVGDMVFLNGITEPLDPVTEQARVLLRAAEHTSQGMRSLDQLDSDRLNAYLTAIEDLEHEGDQLHRRVLAQLYDFTGEHPARHMLRWKDITDGIEHALNELAHVAHTVEGIVLNNA